MTSNRTFILISSALVLIISLVVFKRKTSAKMVIAGWITNSWDCDKNYLKHALEKGHNNRVILFGQPQKTKDKTVKQLCKMGVVGLYDQKRMDWNKDK